MPEHELRLALMAESEGVTQQTTREGVTQSDTLTIAHETSGGATSSGTPTAGTAEHPYPIFNDSDSLLLTVVLEFGAPDAFGHIMPVRGVGGGMVLGVE